MNRPLEEVKTDLDQLSPLDFDCSRIDARGLERLNQFFAEIAEFGTELAALPLQFLTRTGESQVKHQELLLPTASDCAWSEEIAKDCARSFADVVRPRTRCESQ
jgi:hypothetical protein